MRSTRLENHNLYPAYSAVEQDPLGAGTSTVVPSLSLNKGKSSPPSHLRVEWARSSRCCGCPSLSSKMCPTWRDDVSKKACGV